MQFYQACQVENAHLSSLVVGSAEQVRFGSHCPKLAWRHTRRADPLPKKEVKKVMARSMAKRKVKKQMKPVRSGATSDCWSSASTLVRRLHAVSSASVTLTIAALWATSGDVKTERWMRRA